MKIILAFLFKNDKIRVFYQLSFVLSTKTIWQLAFAFYKLQSITFLYEQQSNRIINHSSCFWDQIRTEPAQMVKNNEK